MQNIINKIRSVYPISDVSLNKLVSNLTFQQFHKREMIAHPNMHNRNAFFIEKGITRSFWLVDGREVTTWFSLEGDITFSMNDLYYEKTGTEFIETLEEVDAYCVSTKFLNEIFSTDLEWANWARLIHQDAYFLMHRIRKEDYTLPAKQRYKNMLRDFPDICNRVNLGYIASYLGITLPTLSKIRAEYSE